MLIFQVIHLLTLGDVLWVMVLNRNSLQFCWKCANITYMLEARKSSQRSGILTRSHKTAPLFPRL